MSTWFCVFIADLDPRRVYIGFPEGKRSFLAEQCSKPIHGDPMQPASGGVDLEKEIMKDDPINHNTNTNKIFLGLNRVPVAPFGALFGQK